MFLKQITANNLLLVSCKTNGNFSSKHREKSEPIYSCPGKQPAQ